MSVYATGELPDRATGLLMATNCRYLHRIASDCEPPHRATGPLVRGHRWVARHPWPLLGLCTSLHVRHIWYAHRLNRF